VRSREHRFARVNAEPPRVRMKFEHPACRLASTSAELEHVLDLEPGSSARDLRLQLEVGRNRSPHDVEIALRIPLDIRHFATIAASIGRTKAVCAVEAACRRRPRVALCSPALPIAVNSSAAR
jgi:hypothetical protein